MKKTKEMKKHEEVNLHIKKSTFWTILSFLICWPFGFNVFYGLYNSSGLSPWIAITAGVTSFLILIIPLTVYSVYKSEE